MPQDNRTPQDQARQARKHENGLRALLADFTPNSVGTVLYEDILAGADALADKVRRIERAEATPLAMFTGPGSTSNPDVLGAALGRDLDAQRAKDNAAIYRDGCRDPLRLDARGMEASCRAFTQAKKERED